MADDEIDDEYAARLLKQDATDAAKKYELVGIDAFNPKRSRPGAPKPNTNFLRHIIRQTDSHNAALLAKEAEDSRARLRQMNKGNETEHKRASGRGDQEVGRLTPPDASDNDTGRHKRRRRDHSEKDEQPDSRGRREHQEKARGSVSRRDRSRDRRQKRRRDDSEEGEQSARKSNRRHKDRPSGYSSDDEKRPRHKERSSHRHKRRRSGSRSRARVRSSSPPHSSHHRSSRHRQKDPSPRRATKGSRRHADDSRAAREIEVPVGRSSSPSHVSDPLEAIVGPLPPPREPAVRSRGRGAHKINATDMDTRFSSTYDPAMDVQSPSDDEADLGDAVEAFRDRQRWKQQGAERLKAAGFTSEQAKKWERGDEKDEEDVKWVARGQAREWDRGKVIDADGDVEFKAEFGRLK